jgi:hypothetical protein|tara:strand:- start:17 stop:247 length:231 start_codon:yes stop_codon:yes gene_type:complete
MRRRTNLLKTRQIAIGRKRYYENLRKPRFIWLYNFINKLCDNLIDLAFKVKRLNRKYNEVEYQKMRYKTIYKTEYI